MTNIIKSWNGRVIRVRDDRYMSLTDMAQATGKRVNNWLRLESTNSYLSVLSRSIKVNVDRLIEVNESEGSNEERGTWAYPKVAIRFARWCSEDLAFQIDFWVDELILESINLSTTIKESSGFVYLMQSNDKWYKIGMSKQPYKRMSSIQTGTPMEVVLIHRVFTLNCKLLEKALHDYYKPYWVRGEWFDLPKMCVDEFPLVASQLDVSLEKKYLAN